MSQKAIPVGIQTTEFLCIFQAFRDTCLSQEPDALIRIVAKLCEALENDLTLIECVWPDSKLSFLAYILQLFGPVETQIPNLSTRLPKLDSNSLDIGACAYLNQFDFVCQIYTLTLISPGIRSCKSFSECTILGRQPREL